MAQGRLDARVVAPGHPHLRLARALHDYENVVYTPGPVAAGGLVVVVVGALLGRGRRARAACVLFGVTGLLLLVMPVLSVDFDYRYVLGATQLLVAGAAAGLVAIAARLRADQNAHPRAWLVAGSRRVRIAAVCAVAAAMSASNLLGPQAYASGHYRNTTVAPAGTTVDVAHRFRITLSTPRADASICRNGVVHGLYVVHVDERWTGAGELAAIPDNLTVTGKHRRLTVVAQPYDVAGALHPTRLSRRYPQAAGDVYLDTPGPTGRLVAVYTDPLGAGGAAWSLTLPASGLDRSPGTPCS
jgi:hypothetical protein